MVVGVGRASYPEAYGEARLLCVESPKSREEPRPGISPDQGVGVVEVPGVDPEEVGVPDDCGGVDPGACTVIVYPNGEVEAHLHGVRGLYELGCVRRGGGGMGTSPHSWGVGLGVKGPRCSSDIFGTPCSGQWWRLATASGTSSLRP